MMVDVMEEVEAMVMDEAMVKAMAMEAMVNANGDQVLMVQLWINIMRNMSLNSSPEKTLMN